MSSTNSQKFKPGLPSVNITNNVKESENLMSYQVWTETKDLPLQGSGVRGCGHPRDRMLFVRGLGHSQLRRDCSLQKTYPLFAFVPVKKIKYAFSKGRGGPLVDTLTAYHCGEQQNRFK